MFQKSWEKESTKVLWERKLPNSSAKYQTLLNFPKIDGPMEPFEAMIKIPMLPGYLDSYVTIDFSYANLKASPLEFH